VERISDNIVDISVREDAARRRAIGHAVDCKKAKDYTVDWSCFGVSDVASLRQHVPRVGEVFKANRELLQRISAERAEEDKAAKQVADHEKLRDIYTFGESTKQAVMRHTEVQSNQMTYIKAKDRTYAFIDKSASLGGADGAHPAVGKWMVRNAQGVLEERLLTGAELQAHEEQMKLFRCTVLRLGGNKLPAITDTFAADLKQLIFRPMTHLSILDLSSNNITTLSTEGLADLPLHTLYLHDNRISDVQELYKLEPLGARLRKLSLYGNPLQRLLHPDLRPVALAILPFLSMLDDSVVTQRERADLGLGVGGPGGAGGGGKAQPLALAKAQTDRQRILRAKSRADAIAAHNAMYMSGAGPAVSQRHGSPQSPTREENANSPGGDL